LAVDVVWIFSLPRSGSSVTAYAAAKPFGAVVADEVLGPWDRTGAPYNYPALQKQLVEAYHGSRCVLTPEVIGIATELFELLGEKTGRVVSKHPHLKPPPSEFHIAFPDHRAIWLMRNPLRRLNSLYTRGWTDDLRPNYELDHFKAFARNWMSLRERVVFEQMKRQPEQFFRLIYKHWGWTQRTSTLQRRSRTRGPRTTVHRARSTRMVKLLRHSRRTDGACPKRRSRCISRTTLFGA